MTAAWLAAAARFVTAAWLTTAARFAAAMIVAAEQATQAVEQAAAATAA